jgi:hypothetical protein
MPPRYDNTGVLLKPQPFSFDEETTFLFGDLFYPFTLSVGSTEQHFEYAEIPDKDVGH